MLKEPKTVFSPLRSSFMIKSSGIYQESHGAARPSRTQAMARGLTVTYSPWTKESVVGCFQVNGYQKVV